jgi:hypothetical protein
MDARSQEPGVYLGPQWKVGQFQGPEEPPRSIDLAAAPREPVLISTQDSHASVISVEVKLALYRIGWVGVDAISLTASLSAIRARLQSFVVLTQPTQACQL